MNLMIPRTPFTETELLGLNRFFNLLYYPNDPDKPDDKIYFFIQMPEERRTEYIGTNITIPFGSGSRRRDLCKNGVPCPYFKDSKGSTTVNSRQFNSQMQKLKYLNEFEYGIFFTANPLSGNRSTKNNVKEMRYFIIESDKMPLTDQEIFLEMIKNNVRVAVNTGHRSIHMYIAINPPIKNHDCVYGYEAIKKLIPWDISNEKWSNITDSWKWFMEQYEFCYDPRVLTDWSRLIRVPYFQHPITKTPGSVIFADEKRENSYSPTTFISDIETDRKGLESWEKLKGKKFVIEDTEEQQNLMESVYDELRDGNGDNELDVDVASELSATEPHTKPVIRSQSIQNRKTPQYTQDTSSTFIDYLNEYKRLRDNGIPQRGHRIESHKILITASRVFCWPEERLFKEFEEIIRNPNTKIGCSTTDAIQDFRQHWEKTKKNRTKPRLPNTKSLPDVSEAMKKRLVAKFKEMGCCKPTAPANIIIKVLYPLIKEIPSICIRGRCSIMASSIQKTCGGNDYSKIGKAFLRIHNILVQKSRYKVGKHTILYFINLHYILWLMDFKSEDLDWTRY